MILSVLYDALVQRASQMASRSSYVYAHPSNPSWIRTSVSRKQNPLPFHLAIGLYLISISDLLAFRIRSGSL